jgi:hypothetical protein
MCFFITSRSTPHLNGTTMAYPGDDPPDRLGRVGLVEFAVKIVEKLDVANVQHLRSR